MSPTLLSLRRNEAMLRRGDASRGVNPPSESDPSRGVNPPNDADLPRGMTQELPLATGKLVRPRNDPRQYDDLADTWWDPRGPFAMLHWIAEARAALIPPAQREGQVLLDLACGAGLMAPHAADKGYTHIGLDITASALTQARGHGVTTLRADVLDLPLADESADVVTAGEILEHVTDLSRAIAESARVLKPGGTLVIDTIADTALGRLIAVTIAERIPGGAPPGIHDPALFVDRKQLVAEYARHGVRLQLRGMRPALPSVIAWQSGRAEKARMVPMRTTAVLFQGIGRKALA